MALAGKVRLGVEVFLLLVETIVEFVLFCLADPFVVEFEGIQFLELVLRVQFAGLFEFLPLLVKMIW